MACKQNQDLRCVLISDPSTLGAGAKTRLHTPKAVAYHEQPHYCRFMIGHSLGRMESRIKKFTPHCVCRPVAAFISANMAQLRVMILTSLAATTLPPTTTVPTTTTTTTVTELPTHDHHYGSPLTARCMADESRRVLNGVAGTWCAPSCSDALCSQDISGAETIAAAAWCAVKENEASAIPTVCAIFCNSSTAHHTTPSPRTCRCNGKEVYNQATNENEGGPACTDTHNGEAYCYTDAGTCADGQASGQLEGFEFSVAACVPPEATAAPTVQDVCPTGAICQPWADAGVDVGICTYGGDITTVTTTTVTTPTTTSKYGHYSNPADTTCRSDETTTTLHGVAGDEPPGQFCAPRCDAQTPCPQAVPKGTTASPQCVLAATAQDTAPSRCGLVCMPGTESRRDNGCPQGADCVAIGGIGVCTYRPPVTTSTTTVTTTTAYTGSYGSPFNGKCLSSERIKAMDGVAGQWCAPECSLIASKDCPDLKGRDKPAGTGKSVRAKCLIYDTADAGQMPTRCAMLCDPAANDCPVGATCKDLGQAQAGICTYDEPTTTVTTTTSTATATTMSWTACTAGTFVVSTNTDTNVRVCQACPAGQFQDNLYMDKCEYYTTCYGGFHISAPGTATTDQVCGECETGSFSTTLNADTCRPCSKCADYPAFTALACTTRSDAVCQSVDLECVTRPEFGTTVALVKGSSTCIRTHENFDASSAVATNDKQVQDVPAILNSLFRGVTKEDSNIYCARHPEAANTVLLAGMTKAHISTLVQRFTKDDTSLAPTYRVLPYFGILSADDLSSCQATVAMMERIIVAYQDGSLHDGRLTTPTSTASYHGAERYLLPFLHRLFPPCRVLVVVLLACSGLS